MKSKKIELECQCFGHRLAVKKDEDGIVYISICERKKGKPKWMEVVLFNDKVGELREFLKLPDKLNKK